MLHTDQNCLVYYPARYESELRLVFAYKVPVAPKSVVATLKWIPQDESDETVLNTSWSPGLDSHYVYAPASETPGLRKGANIKFPSRGKMEIRLVNWPSRTPIGTDVVSGLYAHTNTSETGLELATLQRIDEIGLDS